jgi:BON domain
MKNRRFLSVILAAGVLIAFGPSFVMAQGTGTGTGTGTGSTGTGTGTGLGGTGSSSNTLGSGMTSSTGTTTTPKGPTSGTGSATSIPSSSNAFGPTYVDWMSLGNPKNYVTTGTPKPSTASGTYGKGIYTTTTSTSTSTAGGSTHQPTSVLSQGPRAPQYSTVLSDNLPIVVHATAELQTSVQAMIDRSTYIKNRDGIKITVSGNTVELSGQVTSERERRTIEGMVRMTPGVRGVDNGLTVLAK